MLRETGRRVRCKCREKECCIAGTRASIVAFERRLGVFAGAGGSSGAAWCETGVWLHRCCM